MTKTVLNALGETLYYSGTSKAWISATGAGTALSGTAANDSMYGDSAVNVTMSGGDGDDVYYLYSSINRAAEAAGQGIDTVDTWMSYTLPDNIENLRVTGDNRFAFGNDLDNIISGSSSRQTFDGGAGNDVLTGGGGADTFIVAKGNGSDLITDFSADDKIRLDGYSFTSFEQVGNSLTQEGPNLRLDLGDGDSLVFAGTTADDLSADQFALSLDRSVLTKTFGDEFNALSLNNGTSGTWDANFHWAPDQGSSLPTNGESQWYVNPLYAPTAGYSPFSVSNGALTITAKNTPDAISDAVNGYDYVSGMLNTHSTFSQTYGYFEMRADMPTDQATWPAFWLLPEDGSWPPEIDVVEMRGQDPNTVHVSAHSNETGKQTTQTSAISVPSTEGFHTYGMLWTEEEIVWYFDDVAIASAETPSDMHDPMYLLVNLAVGGAAGKPGDLSGGAKMVIDYIHAYEIDDDAAPTSSSSSASDDGLV